jgi:signal transduction histidine kinase
VAPTNFLGLRSRFLLAQDPDDLCSSLNRLPLIRPSPFRDGLYFKSVGLAGCRPRAQHNLIASMADELRAPLASLSLGFELLQRDPLGDWKDRIATAIIED